MIFIEKILALRTDALFVMNGDDYHIAKKHQLCKKTEYIDGMGIDVEKLNSPSPAFLKYHIPENKKYFLCVGEFSKRKNQKNIIRAFGRFIHSLPDYSNIPYHLIFLGGGVLFDECKRLCELRAIDPYVTFCGYIGDTQAYYQFSDYVVSASEFEGLPFNIMEALYHGKPVIASNVKGHKDLITDGLNGYLYDFNDDVQLFEIFKKVSDTDLQNKICLDEKYYFDNVKEKILNCYRNMR